MTKYCTNCGKELKEGADICLNCGKLINHDNETKKQEPLPTAKSKIAAGILGILLGCFGVHNFYLGYTGKGIAQIFVTLFTCGFGAIWGLIEGIMILTGSINTDAEGNPLVE